MDGIPTVPTSTLVPDLYKPGPDLVRRSMDRDGLVPHEPGMRHQFITRQGALNLVFGCTLVQVPGTDDKAVHYQWLEELEPHAPTSQYQHNRTGEDNANAHLKRQIMGREVVVAVTNNRLDFGPREQIFYGEFDGRRKRALVKIVGE